MSAPTTTGSLSDSMATIINSARIVREAEGKMVQFCDKQTLGEGVGLTWSEVTLDKLTATAITETTELKNPQEISDTIFTLMPTVVGMLIVVTDRVKARIASIVYSKIGKLGQRAIERKRELDGLLVLDGFTTSLCGAGSTLTSGHITAAESRIRANSTEPWDGPVAGVLHTYQVKDLKDEIAGGIGTYPVPEGLSARVFQDGSIKGQVGGVWIVDDNYIAIDSADDAKGGVFASGPGGAIVHVQGRAPWTKEQYNPALGGGATEYYHYDEYIFGERSAGNWGFEIYSDATTPTS